LVLLGLIVRCHYRPFQVLVRELKDACIAQRPIAVIT
jgi:hypothetical protein